VAQCLVLSAFLGYDIASRNVQSRPVPASWVAIPVAILQIKLYSLDDHAIVGRLAVGKGTPDGWAKLGR